MTKEAKNVLSNYEELIKLHVDYYKNHDIDFNFQYRFVRDLCNDFDIMISCMYRFRMISEKDWEELRDLGNDIWQQARYEMYEIKYDK